MADQPPLVSVVLPFHDAPFLRASIESILSQTYQDFELILIDNGADSATKQISHSFENHEQVSLLHEPKKGVVFATNKGIKEANGSLIARMDSDDIAFPDRLAHQVSALQRELNIDVVSGLVQYLGPDENEGFIHYVDWLNTIQSPEALSLNRFVEFPLANPSMMLRKSLFDQHGYYEEGPFPEDYEFFLRLQRHQVKMVKVPEYVLKWRDSPQRLTRTDSRYSTESFYQIKSNYLAKWLSVHNPFHPAVWIWGAGRLSRKRSSLLEQEGIKIAQYIDLESRDNVMAYTDLPPRGKAFILSYVANRGARDEIRNYLNEKGYQEGFDFILAS